MKGLLGKKVGMTHLYAESGEQIPVTVVEAGPCTVIKAISKAEDGTGYNALQLGFGSRKKKNVSKPVLGQFKGTELAENPPATIREIRLADAPEQEKGDVLTAEIFEKDEYVDVVGWTKGRGFQGVVKRWNFGGGRASHGGDWTRKPGSIGMCEFPGKVYKGRKMPGHMGNVRRTVQNLQIVQVRGEDNLLLIKGAIPGPNGRDVIIRKAIKK
ncbi:MAG: 50S ribosomal protein L3 [Lentisphaeria bacterium]|nr:50S ribosomal protein L3 [Lentisphaeria bacterium]